MVTISKLPALRTIVESVANKMATTEEERQKLINLGEKAALDLCTEKGYSDVELHGPGSYHRLMALWEAVTYVMKLHANKSQTLAGGIRDKNIAEKTAPPFDGEAAA